VRIFHYSGECGDVWSGASNVHPKSLHAYANEHVVTYPRSCQAWANAVERHLSSSLTSDSKSTKVFTGQSAKIGRYEIVHQEGSICLASKETCMSNISDSGQKDGDNTIDRGPEWPVCLVNGGKKGLSLYIP
jgi:hypothetical protein